MAQTIKGTSTELIKNWISAIRKDIQRNDWAIDGSYYGPFLAKIRMLNDIFPANIFLVENNLVSKICQEGINVENLKHKKEEITLFLEDLETLLT